MSYLILSFTHKNTEISTREKLSFTQDDQKILFLENCLKSQEIKEIMLTSTCNRTEIFCFCQDIHEAKVKILDELQRHSKVQFDVLNKYVDLYDNDGAIYHLFSVVSSLDSLVVGETQIIGQIKESFQFSSRYGFCGKNITTAIKYSSKCASKVRNATSLGTGQVSVASTAVSLAREVFKGTKPQAIIVGAGKMCDIAMRHLLKSGFGIVLINRNTTNAKRLKENIIKEKPKYKNMITIEPFENLRENLSNALLLFSATSSSSPIITDDMIGKFTQHCYWFDMAIPRDIQSIQRENLTIYAVDDLKVFINKNKTKRENQAKEAIKIIEFMQKEFFEYLKEKQLAPIVKNLYKKADNIINEKVQTAIKKGYVNRKDSQNIEKLCQTIIKKLLHNTTKNIKKTKNKETIDIIKNFFDN